jgi:hypothetical protein
MGPTPPGFLQAAFCVAHSHLSLSTINPGHGTSNSAFPKKLKKNTFAEHVLTLKEEDEVKHAIEST